jgi:hypothetical protein
MPPYSGMIISFMSYKLNIMASIDIIEKVRNYMGTGPVPKIDPNTQEPNFKQNYSHNLDNAVIPVLLVGFYKHSRNEIQASELMQETGPDECLNIMFANSKNDIVKSVASYAGVDEVYADTELKRTVSAIKEVLKKEIKATDPNSVTSFFTTQRSNILKHLPAELNVGELMEDPSVDDRTNKMEGPMSGIMHTIEKVFSSTK